MKWDLDTNVSRRMAYNHYFGKAAASENVTLGVTSHEPTRPPGAPADGPR